MNALENVAETKPSNNPHVTKLIKNAPGRFVLVSTLEALIIDVLKSVSLYRKLWLVPQVSIENERQKLQKKGIDRIKPLRVSVTKLRVSGSLYFL